MKDIINIIIGKEDITVLEKYKSQKEEQFTKYMNIVKELISNMKRAYNQGLSLENIVMIVQRFFTEYNQNVVLVGYYSHDTNEEEMKEEVRKMIERYLTEVDPSITLVDHDPEPSFSNTSGVEENKVMSLSNGHPTGTETGFISPIILALLTATIEITSLLYIFFQAVE